MASVMVSTREDQRSSALAFGRPPSYLISVKFPEFWVSDSLKKTWGLESIGVTKQNLSGNSSFTWQLFKIVVITFRFEVIYRKHSCSYYISIPHPQLWDFIVTNPGSMISTHPHFLQRTHNSRPRYFPPPKKKIGGRGCWFCSGGLGVGER